MRVPAQHPQVFVAGNAGHFHYIQAKLEEVRRDLMPQVMEMEVFNSGPAYGTDIGVFDGFRGEVGECLAVDAGKLFV